MADEKWSEFNLILGANVAVDDLFAITDTSSVESKSIKYSELLTILASVNTTQILTNKELTSPIIETPDITWDTSKIIGIPTYHNLISSRSSTTSVDIDLNYIILYDATNFKTYKYDNVNLTINSGTIEANGLDTGTYTGGTWYYNWVIGTNAGVVAGLHSLSAVSPSMPATYTYKKLIGATYCTSIGPVVFRGFMQRNENVTDRGYTSIVASGVSAGVEITTEMNTAFPKIADKITIQFGMFTTAREQHNSTFTITNASGTIVYANNQEIGTAPASGVLKIRTNQEHVVEMVADTFFYATPGGSSVLSLNAYSYHVNL